MLILDELDAVGLSRLRRMLCIEVVGKTRKHRIAVGAEKIRIFLLVGPFEPLHGTIVIAHICVGLGDA